MEEPLKVAEPVQTLPFIDGTEANTKTIVVVQTDFSVGTLLEKETNGLLGPPFVTIAARRGFHICLQSVK